MIPNSGNVEIFRRSEDFSAGSDVEPVSGIEPLTCRLQGRFTQGVKLPGLRRAPRGLPDQFGVWLGSQEGKPDQLQGQIPDAGEHVIQA